MQSIPRRVVVIGSLNLDYIASVGSLPKPGETVAATGLIRRYGGKGANQALAAARQGARVTLVGCVGADDEGRAYRKRLKLEGISVGALMQTRSALTGTALIAVDESGENTIIVAPGANGELRPNKLPFAKLLSLKADAILLQFEIPMPTITAVIRWANRLSIPIILNPSPLRHDFPWGKSSVECLIVNAGEAEAIFRLPLTSISANLPTWRKALADYRISRAIITRGAKPTLCLSATEYLQVPALKVKPIDTVGAGDAFAGAFAAHHSKDKDLRSAIGLANCAGALATLKQGAQEAIPVCSETRRAARRLL